MQIILTDIYDVLTILFYRIFVLVVLPVIVLSCATPVAPTGGPPDTTGPIIESTTPRTGTTNFDGDEVRFEFNEFVDRNSVRQNISIEPNLDIDFEINFRRRTVIVQFNDPLPENTTFVVQLGTDVTDTRRNKMTSSYSLALSTGPVLDEGSVTARLRDAERGSVESGERVFLYRAPADFSTPANYVAQSDTAGNINFSYLSEGEYTAVWVDDINRDRIWNPERERAIPFHSETIEVRQKEEFNLGTLYIQRPDTVSPRINGVGLLSEKRLRLRISEEVTWNESATFTLIDSLEQEFTTAYPLYSDRADRQILFAQTNDPLPEEMQFTITADGVTDKSGNRLRTDVSPFSGSAEPDTTFLRYISNNSSIGLFPDEPLIVNYSKFIDDSAIRDSLMVFEGDRQIDDWEFVQIERNRLKIYPDENWSSGVRYQFRVWDPDLMDHQRIEPDIWQRNQLGGIELSVPGDDETENRLRIWDDDNKVDIDTTFTGSIEVTGLPPISFHAVVYRDLNESGRWDAGSIDPYEAPEPYFLRRNIPVREGFTSEVRVEFAPLQTTGVTIPDFPDEDDETNNEIEMIDEAELENG